MSVATEIVKEIMSDGLPRTRLQIWQEVKEIEGVEDMMLSRTLINTTIRKLVDRRSLSRIDEGVRDTLFVARFAPDERKASPVDRFLRGVA